ncbi:hypothetical protein PAXRUDRAFT_19004 [Paxillus rubicundulus Ve08.2h10]|uniref:Secreted protein n=1 Tax=Paxillus rubicundulus Ve08.2h10 TaxID=930991 RepID=A0A0D0CWK7_9AGAM|nr:hypothetical protein PAXRUDRAFT_19004 [Paxillus rubicundulus Ve08.2h10]
MFSFLLCVLAAVVYCPLPNQFFPLIKGTVKDLLLPLIQLLHVVLANNSKVLFARDDQEVQKQATTLVCIPCSEIQGDATRFNWYCSSMMVFLFLCEQLLFEEKMVDGVDHGNGT